MSAYNILSTEETCPHCGARFAGEINLYFGYLDLSQYQIGDTYRWAKKGGPKKGGRPEDGTCDGEGYSECPVCGRDFFLVVRVEQDRIVSAEPDPRKPGYIKRKKQQ